MLFLAGPAQGTAFPAGPASITLQAAKGDRRMLPNYEKLGAFYLGRAYDLAAGKRQPDLILYDSKDLTTHAVIIGMTGSGKTGLGIGLLEEALMDQIPVIAIDPKGDLPNLLLQFPELQPENFEPWINPQDAAAHAMTGPQFAARQAETWRRGLADWDQTPERIARLRAAADCTVFTPGSRTGRPVNVLRSFAPPPPAILEDLDLLRDRIQTTATSLLALMGLTADPIASREHILLANILEQAWSAGRALDLAGLIQAIQAPPFERIGVLDLETFFPSRERMALALRLNNLLAAPGFEAWMEGPPLDIDRLLYTPEGRPRASIFTISHLSDAQRMFFVAMLLNAVLGWIRTQPGTASLRAILYMDEIFGYFPPVANPPSKGPLLTLLKQARAYGLGVVLSTQNPVDLDYKGLANTGTWFIGRLQTERDKERVLSGLEGASAGRAFDRQALASLLASLGKRVFLLHNVHENQPAVFETRWVLSYLSGPMTRTQIKQLSGSRPTEIAPPVETPPEGSGTVASPPPGENLPLQAPSPPAGVEAFFLAASGSGHGLYYQPAVMGCLDLHYTSTRYGVDTSQNVAVATPIAEGPMPVDWDQAVPIDAEALETGPPADAGYGRLPAVARKSSAFTKWRQDLLRWARQNHPLVLHQAKALKLTSEWGESESQFRGRLAQALREARDREVEKLRRKYEKRFTTLNDRLMRAEQAIDRESEQVKAHGFQTAISFGSAVLGAFLGRKVVSARSTSRMGSAMKSASRMRKEKMDVDRARERAAAIRMQLEELDTRLQADIDNLETALDPAAIALKSITIRPKSTDITMTLYGLGWLPYRRNAGGGLGPDWR
jgi:hypothetical protein